MPPTCWLWWRDNDEENGGDDDQRDERTTSPKNVCWLYYRLLFSFCCYLFGLPHAGYGRGIMTRKLHYITLRGHIFPLLGVYLWMQMNAYTCTYIILCWSVYVAMDCSADLWEGPVSSEAPPQTLCSAAEVHCQPVEITKFH